MKTVNPTTSLASSIRLAAVFFLAVATSSQAQIQPCIETNGYKFIQWPNLSSGTGGMDVKDSRQGIVLADDFFCTSAGPITDIHLWGSWLNDVHGLVTNFWIGIYSDVPKVIGPVGQVISNSHPGTLLWWTNFPAGQYAETIINQPGPEYFYNPTNNQIVGGDTQAWYYCFYPANPFVQQGSANNPTNYWLAVHAQLSGQTTDLFGWKNSTNKYNDTAVWGTVDASGFPSGNWQSMTNPITQQQMDLAFKLTTPTNPPVDCVETNGTKYLQNPNLDGGSDVLNNPYVLADDFVCTNTGYISDIHIWGSWLFNAHGTNTFWLGIYDDVPATNLPAGGTTPSHPGKLLWQQWFAPGQYAENLYGTGFEYFVDPGPPTLVGTDQQAWYYCFYPTNPMVQFGSRCAPKIYWLAAYVQQPTGEPQFNYGWKTTYFVQNDVSVHAPWPGVPPTNNPGWTPTLLPPGAGNGGPADLAFKITTATNPPAIKYVQWPNTVANGYDVWNSSTFPPGVTDGPWLLADDFVCTNTGYITDIHLWGSWNDNQYISNSITFWLALFEDVPTNASNPFSHPGNLVWSQCFAPGEYSESFWSFASEQFLDPGPPNTIGTDSQVYYYNFYPCNPPVQRGTPIHPRTYWLGAYAQLPAGVQSSYGWKTTTNVLHDTSVHAQWIYGFCPTSLAPATPAWTPTQDAQNNKLDLSFELTTDTNCYASLVGIDYLALSNKVVLSWSGGGILQVAGMTNLMFSTTNVLGPYEDVPGATSPFTIATTNTLPAKFFRLRCN
ncbi:MAG: hypothetical protein PHY43_07200 [Verrucomicrobiales bacterium]|nr:hypothetical protein [Verrucomicrobiales bacterium]